MSALRYNGIGGREGPLSDAMRHMDKALRHGFTIAGVPITLPPTGSLRGPSIQARQTPKPCPT